MEKTVKELIGKVAVEVATKIYENPELPADPKSMFILGAEFMDKQYQEFFEEFRKALTEKVGKDKADEQIKATLETINKRHSN